MTKKENLEFGAWIEGRGLTVKDDRFFDPAGNEYVLVPIKPTHEMNMSGIYVWKDSPFAIETIYKAMINARPR